MLHPDLSNSELIQRVQHRTGMEYEAARSLIEGWRRGEKWAISGIKEIFGADD